MMGTVVRRPGQDLPKATTPKDRCLTVNAHRHKDMTAKELGQKFAAATGRTISKQKVYRRLAMKALYARRPVVWNSSCTPLHAFDVGFVTVQQYKNEVLEPHVRRFRGAIGQDFIFVDDNARSQRANLLENFLEEEGICRREWTVKSPDLNPIEHVWEALGRAISRRQYPPNTHQTLNSVLVEEWGLLTQEEINILICSMKAHCEACIASRSGHLPY
ncbi:transposable element Tcb1 transposase [Trichonephila clavipes]|nr:transposable element Tcb1 transposase [Trichonephila clavipes]